MARLSLWTVCVWTAVTVPVWHALEIQYPARGKRENLNCKCKNKACQAVFWCWMGQGTGNKLQFLLYYNNAERVEYANDALKSNFKSSKREGSTTIYTLSIVSVQENNAGRYFCFIQYPGGIEPGGAGIELRPGESPPTSPPPTKRPTKPTPCNCRKHVRNVRKEPLRACHPEILWPLVGVLLGLAVVLIGTLYYFSRLPKKCRHKFVKKQQLM
ncbi:uncharacterized protein cd8b [Scleropages formosus]|uniref:uncharacterized protein cd8b n=1 Tax=Scleropages formosus TaxID=113540 RepID=UPI000878F8A5|nr:uncharacterized protein LOC108939017 [Scleropages formosus]